MNFFRSSGVNVSRNADILPPPPPAPRGAGVFSDLDLSGSAGSEGCFPPVGGTLGILYYSHSKTLNLPASAWQHIFGLHFGPCLSTRPSLQT
jgi:hypothetical protein